MNNVMRDFYNMRLEESRMFCESKIGWEFRRKLKF